MQGPLHATALLRLACQLGWRRATGRLELRPEVGPAHALHLRAGDVVAAELGGGDVRLGEVLRREVGVDARRLEALCRSGAQREPLLGRRVVAHGLASEAAVAWALQRQTEVRLSRLEAESRGPGSYRFDAAAPPPSARVRVRPVSLLGWVRARVRAELSCGGAERLARRFAEAAVWVEVAAVADPAMLQPVERRLLRSLGEPVSLLELCERAGATPCEALELLSLVDHAGLLRVRAAAPSRAAQQAARPARPVAAAFDHGLASAARRVLGVEADAPPSAIRAAFRRLVRELHPDRHGAASSAVAHALGERLGHVTSAYRLLAQVGALSP